MKLTSCTGRRCGGEKPARSNPESDKRREPASAMPFSEPCGTGHGQQWIKRAGGRARLNQERVMLHATSYGSRFITLLIQIYLDTDPDV